MRSFLANLVIVAAMAMTSQTSHARTPEVKPDEARNRLARISDDLGNLETNLAGMIRDLANVEAERRFFPVERRLLDADLLFETGRYDQAAVLYSDLADNPVLAGRIERYRILFQLAESLSRTRDMVGARRRFALAAVPEAGPWYLPSLARLFETSIQTNDHTGLDAFGVRILDGTLSTPPVLYSFGKYLHSRGRFEQAAAVLARVPEGSPEFFRAQYFLGVMEAGAGKLPSAWARFRTASAIEPASDGDREVRSAALLAIGRVLCLQGRNDECLVELQRVDERSSAFGDALFETAWAFYRLGDLPRAVHALNVLLMTFTEGDRVLRASALRGRILTRMRDPDGAAAAYHEVATILAPIAAELDSLVEDPRQMRQYFDYMARKDTDSFDAPSPVSARADRWIESDDKMGAIASVFRDIQSGRADSSEGSDIVEELLWVLGSGNRLEAFPNLKERFLRLKELESRFVASALDILSTAEGILRGRLDGDDARRHAEVSRLRGEAASRFDEIPVSVDDYQIREGLLGTRLRELGEQIFRMESGLRMELQQVAAVEEWLRQRAAEGSPALSPGRDREARKDLDQIRKALVAQRAEAGRLRESLEREALALNSPEGLDSDDRLRSRIVLRAIEEAMLLRGISEGLEGDAGFIAKEASDLALRAARGASGVRPVVQELLALADRGARDLETAVLREKTRMDASMAEAQRLELEARAFAEAEGPSVFRGVRERIAGVLLESDLGLVDMAWQREQEVADLLRRLGRERAEKMKGLEELERMIREDETAGVPADAGGPLGTPPGGTPEARTE
jgi:tetratricopeptide (TPR) repeat protein